MPDDLPVAVRDVRDRVIALLSERFAEDSIDLEEFDRRVTLAHRSSTAAELEKLVEDLQPTALTRPTPPRAQALVPASQVKRSQTAVAILGGAMRKGPWNVPHELRIIAMMGGAELDFREARLSAGETEIHVYCLLGGVHIIVPPELAVDVNGVAIMGGFDHMERAPAEPDPDRPVIRVHGVCVMGGVSVETRLVGESGAEAQRRRRRERKARRARV